MRALMLTACSGWLAGRVVRAHYGMPCLGAVSGSLPVVVRPYASFILEAVFVLQREFGWDARIVCVACVY